MRVDFYQLADAGALAPIVTRLAGRLVGDGQRLLIVHDDAGERARLDRLLWAEPADGFLPHAVAGEGSDAAQPVLISASDDAPNGARNLLVADGQWREAALTFERAFFLFDAGALDGARAAWKALAGRDGVERHYWAQEDGRWTQKA